MNTLKTVFGKLFKEETQLASHEVELNAVVELQKGAAKIGGQILSLEMDILSKANDMKKLSTQYENFIKQFREFEVKAKELGIDAVANQAKESVDFYNEKIKRADRYLTTIQGLTKR